MRSHQRQEHILRAVRARRSCSIAELAEELSVSDETIRRSLRPLVDRGLVERVHGGVVLGHEGEPEAPFQRRMQENVEAKRTIAKLVAGVVADGDSIMLDTGSTTAFVARALRGHRGLSVVTNCTEIARTLAAGQGNSVHIAGGELRADDSAVFGASAIAFVRQFQVRYAILSIGAVSDDAEFMDFHLAEAEFSRAVIGQAQTVIVAADHSKFGHRAFVRVCDSAGVDILVTDRPLAGSAGRRFADAGVRVVVPAP